MSRGLSLIIVVLIGVFSCVWQQVQVMEMDKRINGERQKLKDYALKERMLKFQIANLSSLDRLEKVSKELGLVKPKAEKVVYVPEPQEKIAKPQPIMSTGRELSLARLFSLTAFTRPAMAQSSSED